MADTSTTMALHEMHLTHNTNSAKSSPITTFVHPVFTARGENFELSPLLKFAQIRTIKSLFWTASLFSRNSVYLRQDR